MDRVELALEYAERARSRALIDLISFQVELDVLPRSEEDRPLTDRLAQLRSDRDRLHRRWLAVDRLEPRGASPGEAGNGVDRQVLEIERQITELWHQLLVRHAGYADDAALCQVRAEPFRPLLPDDTVLLEWFFVHDRLVLFVAARDRLESRRLDVDRAGINRLLALLRLNLQSVSRCPDQQLPALATNARKLLGRLYTLLVAPAQELVASYVRWILVPHGPLHYLPFHALHDGRGYLIEAHEISALPGAGLLAHCRRPRPGGAGLLALGYSCDGRLPHAVEEALQVAATYGGEACVEEDATAGRIRSGAAGRRILHLATHGDFRADNPLFSGVALADGWLTTLDCFGLRLDASLVTLSGCQTGMSVIGGGDELLGLTRALLAAGAASLVLSLWAVEDASTARLMAAMYANLAAGCTKGEALRRAQLGFINGGGAAGAPEAARLAHPYTWAPFMLMGDAGAL
jgi:CHAT domain-containing protein